MPPKKRISRIGTLATEPIIRMNDNNTRSIGIQTEPIKPGELRAVMQPRRLVRPTSDAYDEAMAAGTLYRRKIPVNEDTDPTRNKACQTMKTGLGPTPVAESQVISDKMDNLRATMAKRRAQALEGDRQRLAALMEIINADPPPSWKRASLMWLEVDELEKRIENAEALTKSEQEVDKTEENDDNQDK